MRMRCCLHKRTCYMSSYRVHIGWWLAFVPHIFQECVWLCLLFLGPPQRVSVIVTCRKSCFVTQPNQKYQNIQTLSYYIQASEPMSVLALQVDTGSSITAFPCQTCRNPELFGAVWHCLAHSVCAVFVLEWSWMSWPFSQGLWKPHWSAVWHYQE